MSNQSTSNSTPSRRELLRGGAVALATAATIPVLTKSAWAQTGTAPSTAAPATTPLTAADPASAPTPGGALPAGDVEIVRFALTLERLEAAFYSQVLGAQQTRAYLPERLLTHAQSLAAAEAAHVQTLETLLTSVGQEVPAAQSFKFPGNVFVSQVAFAWFGFTLEEIGIGAYLGAAPKIQTPSLRRAAASIYGAEARHAAVLRSFAGYSTAPHYFESPLSVEQVTTLITPYLA